MYNNEGLDCHYGASFSELFLAGFSVSKSGSMEISSCVDDINDILSSRAFSNNMLSSIIFGCIEFVILSKNICI